MTEEYEFTQDWFSPHIPMWERWMAMLPSRKRFLEIGSYEGRSAVWLIEHGIQGDYGFLHCIDPWVGNGEHAPPGVPIDDKRERFERNVEVAKKKRMEADNTMVQVVASQSHSMVALANAVGLKLSLLEYDFIYVDGSHLAKDCLTDCILAWPLLRPAGLMVIDDYTWGDGTDIARSPKIAIDVFTSLWGGELDFVGHGNQVVLRKRVPNG